MLVRHKGDSVIKNFLEFLSNNSNWVVENRVNLGSVVVSKSFVYFLSL